MNSKPKTPAAPISVEDDASLDLLDQLYDDAIEETMLADGPADERAVRLTAFAHSLMPPEEMLHDGTTPAELAEVVRVRTDHALLARALGTTGDALAPPGQPRTRAMPRA